MARVQRDAVNAVLGTPEKSGDGEWLYACPKCPPGKDPKLGVNYRKQAFHCFRCGWSGHASVLAKEIGAEVTESTATRRQLSRTGEGKATPKKRPKRAPKDVLESLRYLNRELTFAEDPAAATAWRYLTQVRGLDPLTIRRARLAVTDHRAWYGYVVFPVWSDISRKEVVYLTGRAFVDGLMKQRNPPAMTYPVDRGQVIYAQERMALPGWAVVCEAPLDALSVGSFAGATYGTQVTDEQVAVLAQLPVSHLVVYFDAEPRAQLAAWDLAARLSGSYVHGTSVAVPPESDPGECTQEQNALAISRAFRYNSAAHHAARLDLERGRLLKPLDIPSAAC